MFAEFMHRMAGPSSVRDLMTETARGRDRRAGRTRRPLSRTEVLSYTPR